MTDQEFKQLQPGQIISQEWDGERMFLQIRECWHNTTGSLITTVLLDRTAQVILDPGDEWEIFCWEAADCQQIG